MLRQSYRAARSLASHSVEHRAPAAVAVSLSRPATVLSVARLVLPAEWSPCGGEPCRRLLSTTSAKPKPKRNIQDGPVNSAWTNLGISPDIAQRLAHSFPHIHEPTPAQKLFLLAVLAGEEVYLKDEMGRGKTLALALAALELGMKKIDRTKKAKGSKNLRGTKVLVIVPTPFLAAQVTDLMTKLSPVDPASLFTTLSSPSHNTPSLEQKTLPLAPVVVSTPKNMLPYKLVLPNLTHVFIDEPDTLTGAPPGRHASKEDISQLPIIRHPPPIVPVLNAVLGIKSQGKFFLDFTKRRDEIKTVWTSATMTPDFKRLVRNRGWVRRGNNLVELDFTEGASEKNRAVRERFIEAVDERDAGRVHAEAADGDVPASHMQSHPEHYVLVVDPQTGDLESLQPSGMNPAAPAPPATDASQLSVPLSPYMMEALALLHVSSPPPPGTFSLVLAPETTSLAALGDSLLDLGVPSLAVIPETLQVGLPSTPEHPSPSDLSPVLLAPRSSVPGLHLQGLHTIYLLNGLDFAGLSPKQRKAGALRDRMVFYDLVEGRLGRLGTGIQGKDSRVVSLVMGGSEEEQRMQRMFSDVEKGAVGGRKLGVWDMSGLERMMEEEMLAEQARETEKTDLKRGRNAVVEEVEGREAEAPEEQGDAGSEAGIAVEAADEGEAETEATREYIASETSEAVEEREQEESPDMTSTEANQKKEH